MSFLKAFESSDYSIEVSTKELSVKAEEIKDICSCIICDIDEVKNYVRDLSCIWTSESSKLLKSLFLQECEEYDDIEWMFNVRIAQLNRISSLYEDSEKMNIIEVEKLPNEIIS